METSTVIAFNRSSAPGEDQPSTILQRWVVMEVPTGARVLVGERPDTLTWRRSTPVVEFLIADRVVLTTSGRRYFLEGPPASASDDLDLIRALLETHGIRQATNVTESYWTAMLAAAH